MQLKAKWETECKTKVGTYKIDTHTVYTNDTHRNTQIYYMNPPIYIYMYEYFSIVYIYIEREIYIYISITY